MTRVPSHLSTEQVQALSYMGQVDYWKGRVRELEAALKNVQGLVLNCVGMDNAEDDMLSEIDKTIAAALSPPLQMKQPVD